ncbi:helix-turn-helix transcriptional regulator [Metasolibacillus sp. FSL H7-0170]|uniref:helix-turn-helix domain-containing protein n=1 Tax=Metasolibacillus sp. FSL H7-0170 TaxID=2921431 RepID=UPI0031597BCB
MIIISNKRDLGIALKQLRTEKGLSIREFADLVGVSYSYLSQIETAKREASTKLLGKIAEAVDVSYFDLLKIAGHNDLFELYLAKQMDSESQSSSELLHAATDIKVLLEQTNLSLKAENLKPTFNGHELTAEEAERALAMLYILFPHYKEQKN